ncbi:MAG: four helix bundle protein [Longimicrobiales bacterium]
MFGFEDWDIYKAALELREIAEQLYEYRQPGTAGDLDQFKRGSSSVVLNLAEGYGHRQKGKKLQHYRAVLASAHECYAALEILQRTMKHRRARPLIERGLELSNRIAAMATNLIRKIEGRDP